MDLSRLPPSDAAVALRGLERRYRGLFSGLGDDEAPDDVAHRQVQGWSAIEHIVAAAWAIAAAERALAAGRTRGARAGRAPDPAAPRPRRRRPRRPAQAGGAHGHGPRAPVRAGAGGAGA